MKRCIDITAVIPVFNRAHKITKTIESVLSQDVLVKEIIVVNDGSTDDIHSVIEKNQHQSPVPILLIDQTNLGPGAARNKGAQAASATHILFLDSDDSLTSGAIRRFSEAYLNHTDADMIFGGRLTILPSNKTRLTRPHPLKSDKIENFEDELSSRRPTVGIGAAIVKKKFAQSFPFPENFRVCEDLVFYANAFLHGECVMIDCAQVKIDQTSHHSYRDPNLLYPEHEAAYNYALQGIEDSPRKRRLQNKISAYPALRTFRELHRAGQNQHARKFYLLALKINFFEALKLSYFWKFIRGALGIRHPAATMRYGSSK